MSDDRYRTIGVPGEALFKAKGSKFYGYAYAAGDEAAALEHVRSLRDEHHKARHHCYAYRLGAGNDRWRANDDGEPSGSAGKPILGQIDSAELQDVAVVVVRYFGGTKLGVSGLIEAYRTAAANAIAEATVVVRERTRSLRVDTDYAHLADLMNAIKAEQWTVEEQVLRDDVQIVLSKPASEFDEAYRRLWLVLAKAYPGDERLNQSPPGYTVNLLGD